MTFEQTFQRCLAAIAVLGADKLVMADLHDRAVREGSDEETFFFAWQAAKIAVSSDEDSLKSTAN